MKLMYKEECGFQNFSDTEAEVAKEDDWVDGEPVRQKLLAAKRVAQPVAKPQEVATMPVQSEPRRAGRPRKEEPSILSNGEI
jgi:hypothetical protein